MQYFLPHSITLIFSQDVIFSVIFYIKIEMSEVKKKREKWESADVCIHSIFFAYKILKYDIFIF